MYQWTVMNVDQTWQGRIHYILYYVTTILHVSDTTDQAISPDILIYHFQNSWKTLPRSTKITCLMVSQCRPKGPSGFPQYPQCRPQGLSGFSQWHSRFPQDLLIVSGYFFITVVLLSKWMTIIAQKCFMFLIVLAGHRYYRNIHCKM